MNNSLEKLEQIIEAAILVAGRPLTKADIQKLFEESEQPDSSMIQTAIQSIQDRYQNSGIELREISSGYQFQARTEYSPWLVRLWEERPTKYSRAFLETLALIAYRQPITRAEIEDIRGVAVSSNIIKTLQEREWIRVIGYKDVPGKPALYGTTKQFLDDFNLKTLDQLPTLAEIKDLEAQEEKLQVQLELTHDEALTNTEEPSTNTIEQTSAVNQSETSDELPIANDTNESITPVEIIEEHDTSPETLESHHHIVEEETEHNE